ncbi:hypothetical protein J6590_004566 [Homalodisca vitripennis]|nr:hypothetical protein J6590_004566 [Homalodisca vitripennis]
MTSSLSGAMTDEEEDQEINVDSGHEEGEDEDSCGADSSGDCSPPASLPFSISRLLGDSPTSRAVVPGTPDIASLYSHPALGLKAPQGLLYSPAAGVIRVPAHRPPPPGPPLAAPFPWLAIDPALMHRSAAAAAFASQVVKERLSAQNELRGGGVCRASKDRGSSNMVSIDPDPSLSLQNSSRRSSLDGKRGEEGEPQTKRNNRERRSTELFRGRAVKQDIRHNSATLAAMSGYRAGYVNVTFAGFYRRLASSDVVSTGYRDVGEWVGTSLPLWNKYDFGNGEGKKRGIEYREDKTMVLVPNLEFVKTDSTVSVPSPSEPGKHRRQQIKRPLTMTVIMWADNDNDLSAHAPRRGQQTGQGIPYRSTAQPAGTAKCSQDRVGLLRSQKHRVKNVHLPWVRQTIGNNQGGNFRASKSYGEKDSHVIVSAANLLAVRVPNVRVLGDIKRRKWRTTCLRVRQPLSLRLGDLFAQLRARCRGPQPKVYWLLTGPAVSINSPHTQTPGTQAYNHGPTFNIIVLPRRASPSNLPKLYYDTMVQANDLRTPVLRSSDISTYLYCPVSRRGAAESTECSVFQNVMSANRF